MKFSPNLSKNSKKRKTFSFFVFISISIFFILGYIFIEKIVSLDYIVIALFAFVVFLILILQYFFKNELKNGLIKSNYENQISELRQAIGNSNELAEHESVYLANMSYEIRTPLNTVIGMLNMLIQSDLSDDQKAQVEIANYSSKHLLQLVNMITDNAAVESKDVKLNMTSINLKSELSQLFKIFEYQAWEKGLEFNFKFLFNKNKKSNFLLLGDIMRIRQVLINLINNAIKFTNAGKISIIVDQTVSIDNEQIVTFYIKDTGIGMRDEEITHFFNNRDSTKELIIKDHRGAGIGLSISQKLIKLMGGELKLESKENEGSTFYFSLQLKKTLSVKVEDIKTKPLLQGEFNVLVAEDNRMNQKVIKFLLEKQGADCTFAKNGIEAVELYKILDFDMVFMDIYMPDMDGYQATKAIKETEKYKESNTPIIAVSASAFEEDITNAKEAGINEFLAKPIESSELKELLIKYAGKEAGIISI